MHGQTSWTASFSANFIWFLISVGSKLSLIALRKKFFTFSLLRAMWPDCAIFENSLRQGFFKLAQMYGDFLVA